MKRSNLILVSMLVIAGLLFAACGGGAAEAPAPAQPEEEAQD